MVPGTVGTNLYLGQEKKMTGCWDKTDSDAALCSRTIKQMQSKTKPIKTNTDCSKPKFSKC